MLNKVFVMGRLGRDPELSHTTSGAKVARFSLAVDRDYKSGDGGDRKTDWLNIVAWRQRAEFAAQYLTKGRVICVEGRLEEQKYTDKDGIKRRDVVIVADNFYFADSRQKADGEEKATKPQEPKEEDFQDVEDDGELPF